MCGFSKKLLFVVIVSLLLIPLNANTANGSEDLFETAKLVPGSGVGSFWYGYAVDVSGDTAVTGASLTNFTYVFEKQPDGKWNEYNLELSQITPYFWSAAVSDNTVVVGDPATYLVHIYRKGETGEWDQQDLANPSASWFGYSVAIEGNTLVVGAPSNGSAHVYTFNGSTWTEYDHPLTPNEPTNGIFGYSVAIAGNTVVVGAPPFSASDSGSAHVFTLADSHWTESQKLITDNEKAGDHFGASVAIADDRIVVGAPSFLHLSGPPSSAGLPLPGSAHVFNPNTDNTWGEQNTLTSEANGFGSSVAIRDNRVVVGAPLDQYEGMATGSAHVYSIRENNSPKLEQRLLASDGNREDLFGWSVAMDGTTVLVGALYGDNQVANSGAAYVFVLPTPSEPPVANAGPYMEVLEASIVELDGSKSYDPDGDSLTYDWVQKQIGDEPLVELDLTDPMRPTFVAPELTSTCTTLTLELIVTDDQDLASEPDTVEITVLPNNKIYASLGKKGRRWEDLHIYTFHGTEDERVIITMEPDANGKYRGNRATLILKDLIRGTHYCLNSKRRMTNTLEADLPATGEYMIIVDKKPWFLRGGGFRGDYVLSVEGTCGKLKKTSWRKRR